MDAEGIPYIYFLADALGPRLGGDSFIKAYNIPNSGYFNSKFNGDCMNLEVLVSETRHPDSMAMDTLSTLDMVTLLNQQDKQVPEAIASELPAVAAAIGRRWAAYLSGGRHQRQTGGLDASECPPTFGVPPGKVIGLIAGGPGALLKEVEGAEDDMGLEESDLRHIQLAPVDVVVGLASSGTYIVRAGCVALCPFAGLRHRRGLL